MATIPSEEKVFMVSNGTNTTFSGSAATKAMQEWYTMQDISDTVNSAPSRSYGQLSKMDSATITVNAEGVYQSTGLTGTFSALSSGISLGGNDGFGLKNTSGKTKVFQFFGSIDMGISGAQDSIMGIKFALNGIPVDESECKAWSIQGKAGKLVTYWLFELENGDEVSLYIANFSNDIDFSFSRGRLVAQQV